MLKFSKVSAIGDEQIAYVLLPAPEDIANAIFAKANEMRTAKGVPPFIRDARLDKSAQLHADELVTGKVAGHARLEWRIHTFAGFPDEPCHVSRANMPANYTEGIVDQPDAINEKSLATLTYFGAGEAHYDDFYDPKINCVGIGIGLNGSGYYGNHLVLDYGVLCQAPSPDPAPIPLNRSDFDLW